jgi:hypothetical protein
MAWEANLLQGRIKQCLRNRWWTCRCLEGTNVNGMGDGNIQGKGNPVSYDKKYSIFTVKED